MPLKKTYVLSTLFLCSFLSVFPQTQLKGYTTKDGLPVSSIQEVVQDSLGYLWLATQGGGLVRFDGEEFLTVDSNRDITALHVENDSIFLGSQKGLSIKHGNAFQSWKVPAVNKIISHEGQAYLLTQRGLFVFSEGRPKHVALHSEIDHGIVNDLLFTKEDIWIATSTGLWCKRGRFSNKTSPEKLDANNVVSLVGFQDKVFGATQNDGTYVYATGKPQPLLVREPLKINSLQLQKDNQLWFCTTSEGVVILDANTFSVLKRINTYNGLASNNVHHSFTDRQGTTWLATAGGLYRFEKVAFQHFDRHTGLKADLTHAIHATDKAVWVSSATEGLSKIDSRGIQHISSDTRLQDFAIVDITHDVDGDIWTATNGRGIWVYRDSQPLRPVTHREIQPLKTVLITEEEGLPSNNIEKILVDGENIWAATAEREIVQFTYDKEALQLTLEKHLKNEFEDQEKLLLLDLKKGPRGNIWYSTKGGFLGKVEGERIVEMKPFESNVNTFLFHEEHIVVGTSTEGIWKAKQDDLKFEPVLIHEEQLGKDIRQLLIDDAGNLWVGTPRGLDKIVVDETLNAVEVLHYDANDGFLGVDCWPQAAAKDTEGNLWFGTIGGLTKYSPTQEKQRSVPPTITLEGITANYQPLDSLDLNAYINKDRVLQLDSKQDQLSFRYKSVDLKHPNALQYRFQLNDQEWSPWSSATSQNLVGLGYGAYTFSVQSRNIRRQESMPVRFQFHIEPPLLQKGWFQALMTLLGITLIGLIAWAIIRRIKRKNEQEQERLALQNHLLSLEQKALRLQMNPHFVFNVLNGIKAIDDSESNKRNTTINTFATLLRETLYNSRKEKISLAQEIKTLAHYIAMEQLMAQTPFRHEMIINTTIDTEEILIPPMLVQPFVENAIRHGLNNLDEEGSLNISFEEKGEWLYCSVQDNGKGIFQTQKDKKASNHQSMALQVTKERIFSLSGANALMLEELKEGETIFGTKISFRLPIETDF